MVRGFQPLPPPAHHRDQVRDDQTYWHRPADCTGHGVSISSSSTGSISRLVRASSSCSFTAVLAYTHISVHITPLSWAGYGCTRYYNYWGCTKTDFPPTCRLVVVVAPSKFTYLAVLLYLYFQICTCTVDHPPVVDYCTPKWRYLYFCTCTALPVPTPSSECLNVYINPLLPQLPARQVNHPQRLEEQQYPHHCQWVE